MNQSVKLSKAISYIVIILAALVFLAIWPGEFIQQKYVSKSNELIAMESDSVNVERNVTQMFVGEGGELSAVDLYVCNDMKGETITFRLYDASYTEIFNTFYVVKDNQEFPGFVHIPVGYDLEKDQEYYFTLEGLTADMTVAYEERETSTSIVNGFMSYGGVEIQKYNVIIRYEYSNPFVWWQVLLIGAVIASVAAGVCSLIKFLFTKKIQDKEVKVHNVIRVVLNPIVIIVGLALCLMIFPGRKFGTGMVNYAFYGGSIILLTVLLLYVINYKREGFEPLVNICALKAKLPEYLQSVCLAAVIWYCFEYMNGLYEIHHSFAVRRMLIWFFLGIICTYTKKELLRIGNLIYLAAAGIGVYFYARPYLGIEEEGELYKLQAYIILIGGFVILQLIINLVSVIRKKDVLQKKLFVPYVIAFALLLTLMIVFRNMRDWVWVMAVLFAIFYVRMWFWNKSDRILPVLGNGLILNFIYMVVYSLLHRPYHRYYFYRYGLGYHTVTMTSVYLSLVLCAIIVRFLTKYFKEQKLLAAWLELLLLSVGNIYVFITLSRIGYLAVIVMEVFMILLYVFKEKNHKWLMLGKCLGSILLWLCIMFPVVFTLTRIVPALTNEPVLADVELTGHHIAKGTPTDSELYMDIKRFYDVAIYKVLGINSAGFSSLELEEEELQEDYHWKALCQQIRKTVDNDGVFVVNDEILLADGSGDVEETDALNAMTNGRMDIFKAYIENWNLTGHEDMGVVAENGELLVHAHNVFLQIIHDHGLIAGIAFVLFGIFSFVTAMIRYVKGKNEDIALTIAILLAFAVSGMAEWNFHLCNPYGISVFAAVTPLLFRNRDIKEDEQ